MKYTILLKQIEVQNKNEKQTNLWIPLRQLNIYILSSLHSGIIAYFRKKPWHTSMMVSPAELSLLYARKRGGPKQGQEGAVIGQLWETDWQERCHQDVWQTLDSLIRELH